MVHQLEFPSAIKGLTLIEEKNLTQERYNLNAGQGKLR